MASKMKPSSCRGPWANRWAGIESTQPRRPEMALPQRGAGLSTTAWTALDSQAQGYRPGGTTAAPPRVLGAVAGAVVAGTPAERAPAPRKTPSSDPFRAKAACTRAARGRRSATPPARLPGRGRPATAGLATGSSFDMTGHCLPPTGCGSGRTTSAWRCLRAGALAVAAAEPAARATALARAPVMAHGRTLSVWRPPRSRRTFRKRLPPLTWATAQRPKHVRCFWRQLAYDARRGREPYGPHRRAAPVTPSDRGGGPDVLGVLHQRTLDAKDGGTRPPDAVLLGEGSLTADARGSSADTSATRRSWCIGARFVAHGLTTLPAGWSEREDGATCAMRSQATGAFRDEGHQSAACWRTSASRAAVRFS